MPAKERTASLSQKNELEKLIAVVWNEILGKTGTGKRK